MSIDWEAWLGGLDGEGGAAAGPLPVVGFRAFHMGYGTGTLTSYSHTYEWEPGINTSVPCSQCVQTFEVETRRYCIKPWDQELNMSSECRDPDCENQHWGMERRVNGIWPAYENCRCGFWAAHTLEELMAQQYGHKDPHCIIGGVIGWGRVQVGTKLWRAQYARIIALTDGIPIKAITNRGRVLRWLQDKHPASRIAKTADKYSVPIVPLHRLVSFMSEHGEPAYEKPESR